MSAFNPLEIEEKYPSAEPISISPYFVKMLKGILKEMMLRYKILPRRWKRNDKSFAQPTCLSNFFELIQESQFTFKHAQAKFGERYRIVPLTTFLYSTILSYKILFKIKEIIMKLNHYNRWWYECNYGIWIPWPFNVEVKLAHLKERNIKRLPVNLTKFDHKLFLDHMD